MVIWMTGLSGAGKSTIADELMAMLKPNIPELVLLDGDTVRALFGKNLDYSVPSRVLQVERLQTMAKLLADQGLVVVVTVLYSHPDLLAWNRENLPGYFEVYVDAPLEVVKARDVKGLYAKAARGEMPNVVGIDIPWHPPLAPDLHLETTGDDSPADLAKLIVRSCGGFLPFKLHLHEMLAS